MPESALERTALFIDGAAQRKGSTAQAAVYGRAAPDHARQMSLNHGAYA